MAVAKAEKINEELGVPNAEAVDCCGGGEVKSYYNLVSEVDL